MRSAEKSRISHERTARPEPGEAGAGGPTFVFPPLARYASPPVGPAPAAFTSCSR